MALSNVQRLPSSSGPTCSLAMSLRASRTGAVELERTGQESAKREDSCLSLPLSRYPIIFLSHIHAALAVTG
jgi:hypothetical protein